MTLRELSGKDVIRLKNGENLGRIDDLPLTKTADGCSPSFCAGARTALACWGAMMTLSSVGEHPQHRH